MKKILIVINAFFLLVCAGCTSQINDSISNDTCNNTVDTVDTNIDKYEKFIYTPEFDTLSDDGLVSYIEQSVYYNIVQTLPEQDYYIDNVEVKYISKEYIEELNYNSKSNIFFGYTLKEIENIYKDQKYIFTLENGETTVKLFEDYDDSFEKAIKNIAIGSGVILVCVTVSAVSGGLGAPAVSMIFAASAKTGTIMALSSGTISAAVSGIATGIQTGDMEKAMKAAALSGSESFKWAAFTGVVSGGAGEAIALKGATLNGLSMNEAAFIQRESKYPLDMIKEFHTMDEYNVFKEANLKASFINGKSALIRNDIDLNIKDEYGQTNLERMFKGLAPLDDSGKSFELHHVGQRNDGTIAILTSKEHDNAVLHGFKNISEINRKEFEQIRIDFWKTMATILLEGNI